ncbi:hypothetical protein OF83DRAFT_600280 [Amylostereum chailletii]|nr:hypothetical protein OF83DRAFT_600280 [Amylostereum chailletii]
MAVPTITSFLAVFPSWLVLDTGLFCVSTLSLCVGVVLSRIAAFKQGIKVRFKVVIASRFFLTVWSDFAVVHCNLQPPPAPMNHAPTIHQRLVVTRVRPSCEKRRVRGSRCGPF